MNRLSRFVGIALVGLILVVMRMRGGSGTDEVHPHVVQLSDANFEQEVHAADVVLVDLWAPWCGPCRQVAPAINALAAEAQPGVKIAKLNVDDSPAIAERFEVTGIPTLLIFKRGELVERLVGVRSQRELQAAIDKARD